MSFIITTQYLQDKNQLLLLHETYSNIKCIEGIQTTLMILKYIIKTCLEIFNIFMKSNMKKNITQLMNKVKTQVNK